MKVKIDFLKFSFKNQTSILTRLTHDNQMLTELYEVLEEMRK